MNKLTLLLSFLIAFGQMAFAQKGKKGASDIDLPTPVSKAFNLKYRAAKKTVWTMEEENYRADFKNNDKQMAVCYNPDGKMQYTEVVLDKPQYNKAALKHIDSEYSGYKVSSMRKRDTYDKKTTLIAMLKKGKEQLEVEFDKKGAFIRDTDRTPETASKKKGKKGGEEEEATEDEEAAPAKKESKSKATAKKTDDEESSDEEAAPAKKESKSKATAKKTTSEDNEDEESAPAKKETKAKKSKDQDSEDEESAPAKKETKAKPSKKTSSDDEDEDEDKPAKKETKSKAAPEKKAKKKSTEDEEEE